MNPVPQEPVAWMVTGMSEPLLMFNGKFARAIAEQDESYKATPIYAVAAVPAQPLTDDFKDAMRYRHLRHSFAYSGRQMHRLEWYLPRHGPGDLAQQLDRSIDENIGLPDSAASLAPVGWSDTQRLTWLIEHEGRVGWNREGEHCRVSTVDEDGDMVPVCGWSKFFTSGREAIDAAAKHLGSSPLPAAPKEQP